MKARSGIAKSSVAGIVVLLILIALPTSFELQVTGVAPNPVGQFLNDNIVTPIVALLAPAPAHGSLWGVPFTTDVDGNTVNGPSSPLVGFSSYTLATGSTKLYDSSTGASGAIGDNFYAVIKIVNGTPQSWSITANMAIQLNGRTLVTQSFSPAGTNNPNGQTISVGSQSRDGKSLFLDFGGSPSVGQTLAYNFVVTGGTACVTFAEKPNPTLQNGGCHDIPSFTITSFAVSVTAPNIGYFTVTTSGSSSTSGTGGGSTTTATTATTVPPSGGSVIGSTFVLMADGSQERIDQVKVGDSLQAYQPGQGFAPSTVERVKVVQACGLYTFNGILTSDGIQPFYAQTQHPVTRYVSGFVPADELRVGDSIFAPQSGQWVPITSISFSGGCAPVYDLSLSGFRNYVANGILVNDVKTAYSAFDFFAP